MGSPPRHDFAVRVAAGADQIANDDEASGDADPHVQWLLCGEPADRVDDVAE